MSRQMKLGLAWAACLPVALLTVSIWAAPDELGDCNGGTTHSNQLCVLNGGDPADCEQTGQCYDGYSHACTLPTCTGGSCEDWKSVAVMKYGNGCLDQPPHTTGKNCQTCTGYACSLGFYYDETSYATHCAVQRCQEVRWRTATPPAFVCKP